MRAWLLCCLCSTLLFFLGCTDSTSVTEAEGPAPDSAQPGSQFNPQDTATLSGQVLWEGDAPLVPPFVAPVSPQWEVRGDFLKWPNPNAPKIDVRSKGVRDAVVYLRGVDPHKARPWDHSPATVEQRDYQIHILQAGSDSRCGFVRRGDAIEMVSRQPVFHSLHAGGADFFTLAFPDPNEPLSRRLDRSGLVELSSAAGCYWMRAYLFVAEHPYFCRTDTDGRFTLPQVPPGRYELVCWHPNWQEQSHDRDPESGFIQRLYFAPPLAIVRETEVRSETAQTVSFRLTTDAFAAK